MPPTRPHAAYSYRIPMLRHRKPLPLSFNAIDSHELPGRLACSYDLCRIERHALPAARRLDDARVADATAPMGEDRAACDRHTAAGQRHYACRLEPPVSIRARLADRECAGLDRLLPARRHRTQARPHKTQQVRGVRGGGGGIFVHRAHRIHTASFLKALQAPPHALPCAMHFLHETLSMTFLASP